MGLLPIEFIDCLSDSPYFRENIHAHERELEKTNNQIKGLIRDVKGLLEAAKTLSRAQRNLANTLSNFEFQCIGGSQTDDEIIIAGSLKEFGRLLSSIEDERDRILERAEKSFIEPIEKFRREQVNKAKEGKKKFDKETAKFCSNLERHLNLSTKKNEHHLQEADAVLALEQRDFIKKSLQYVHQLQEVQERKKFEFVETLLSFMYGWLTFYHQGHEVCKDFKSFMTDLQIRIQRTRDNYSATHSETENLMKKMLEIRKTKPQDPGTINKMYSRQGYLFLMEKKAFGTTWTKVFCQYQKEDKIFTMIPYHQSVGKISSTETITLKECLRRMSDTIDKRFCFDVIGVVDKPVTYTFQALGEEDRKLWLDAMDGKDPIPNSTGKLQLNTAIVNSVIGANTIVRNEECQLDELGFAFVRKCIDIIERRGLDDQGLYRVSGVSSKVTRLIQNAFDRKRHSSNSNGGDSISEYVFEFDNQDEWEIRTITSALKYYFRNLPEPLMTFRLHSAFIAAAKHENRELRVDIIHNLVHSLPTKNFEMLDLLISHLKRVANNSEKNLMPVNNLGVCFGPCLLRPEEESVAAIMDTKFANVVVEILIENCDKIFKTKPMEIPSNTQQTQMQHSLSANISSMAQFTAPMKPITDKSDNISVQASSMRGYNPPVNQVYRSASHDQLASMQPPYNRNRTVYTPMNSYPCPPSYGQTSSNIYPYITHQSQTQIKHSYDNNHSNIAPVKGSIPSSKGPSFRPIVVYNPWNNHNTVPYASSTVSTSDYSEPQKSPVNSVETSLVSTPINTQSLQMQPMQYQMKASSPRLSPSSTHVSQSSLYPYTNSNNNSRQVIPFSNNPIQSSITNTSNVVNNMNSNCNNSPIIYKTVRTLYACVGENESELSFEPNVIINNVRQSKEPGWLEGTYNGVYGLIPENYVQILE